MADRIDVFLRIPARHWVRAFPEESEPIVRFATQAAGRHVRRALVNAAPQASGYLKQNIRQRTVRTPTGARAEILLPHGPPARRGRSTSGRGAYWRFLLGTKQRHTIRRGVRGFPPAGWYTGRIKRNTFPFRKVVRDPQVQVVFSRNFARNMDRLVAGLKPTRDPGDF